MRGRRAVLDPTNVQDALVEADLIPTKIDQLGRAKPVPESDPNHRRVPVALPIVLGRLDQALDLRRRQVFAGPQLSVRWTPGRTSPRHCALFGFRGDELQARSHEEILRLNFTTVLYMLKKRTAVSRPFPRECAKNVASSGWRLSTRFLRAILRTDFALFAFQSRLFADAGDARDRRGAGAA